MPPKLTPNKIRKFERHIRRTHPGVVFDLTVTHSFLVGNVIELSTLVVENRKRGSGSLIMRELCEFADRHHVEIRLTPASKGDYGATTSRARLIRFYRRFGFNHETGKHVDATAAMKMVRMPNTSG